MADTLRRGIATATVATLWAASAQAALTVCNRSFDVANVAVGQQGDGVFETRGWWRVGPNQCAEVLRGVLATRYVYVFATDIFGKELLPGSVPLCVGTRRFELRGDGDCLLRGHLPARFLEIDTGEAETWRLFLTPAPE